MSEMSWLVHLVWAFIGAAGGFLAGFVACALLSSPQFHEQEQIIIGLRQYLRKLGHSYSDILAYENDILKEADHVQQPGNKLA